MRLVDGLREDRVASVVRVEYFLVFAVRGMFQLHAGCDPDVPILVRPIGSLSLFRALPLLKRSSSSTRRAASSRRRQAVYTLRYPA